MQVKKKKKKKAQQENGEGRTHRRTEEQALVCKVQDARP